MDHLIDSLKSYSEFDIIDGSTMKNFLAENLVMNYSNIEIHKILFQQMINGSKNNAGQGSSQHRDQRPRNDLVNYAEGNGENNNDDSQQSA